MKHLNLLALVIGIFFVAVCAFVRLADPLPARIAREFCSDQIISASNPGPTTRSPYGSSVSDEASLASPSDNGRGRARTSPAL